MNKKNKTGLGLLAAACLALVAPFASAAEPVPQVYTFQVQFDGNGTLKSARPVDHADDPTTQLLRSELEKWIFEPTAQVGSAVTTTWVRISAVPAGNGIAARVLSANVGPAPDVLSKPVFPKNARRLGHEGVVVLEIEASADGKVSSVKVHDTVGKIDRAMANAALDAARRWSFRPELVDGAAQASKVLMPVCFVASDDEDACAWTGPDNQHFGRNAIYTFNPAARVTSPTSYAVK